MSDGTAKRRFRLDFSALLEALIVAGLIAVAIQESLHATTGLRLPPDPDLYRSAGATVAPACQS